MLEMRIQKFKVEVPGKGGYLLHDSSFNFINL